MMNTTFAPTSFETPAGAPPAEYSEFLRNKLAIAPKRGLDVSSVSQPSYLKHHQYLAVRWAAGLGCALIAARFGLGKTRMQLELLRIVHAQTGKKVLIVCPLGVKYQFVDEDAPIMGMRVQYVRSNEEVVQANTPYLITNFERIREGNIDPRMHDFGCVSIDEGQALRDLGSDTYQTFTDVFAAVPFRFVNSATPAPNNYIELLNYAEFLGVMDRGQALTRWFKRDSLHAGNLTLMPHKEQEFWMWVASWALFLFKPSDIGGDDLGYDLPKLHIYWHRIGTDQSRAHKQVDSRGQRRLLLDAGGGVSQASEEARETLKDRIAKAKELISLSEPIGTGFYGITLRRSAMPFKRRFRKPLACMARKTWRSGKITFSIFHAGRFAYCPRNPKSVAAVATFSTIVTPTFLWVCGINLRNSFRLCTAPIAFYSRMRWTCTLFMPSRRTRLWKRGKRSGSNTIRWLKR